MEFICRHCDKLTVGAPYRVVSEDEGTIILDMIVCHPCFEEARSLGLYAEQIPLSREAHHERIAG